MAWYAKPRKSRGHRTQRANRTCPTRGLVILVARLRKKSQSNFLLCHYFARVKQLWENESCYVGQNEMAGLKGKSGPPGNMNAFKHGLAATLNRKTDPAR